MDTDDDLAAATAARSVQVLTAISMMGENLVRARESRAYRQADHDFTHARTVRAEHQAQWGGARTVYGVTLDRDWSRRATVVDAARAWRASHDWAARDPEAALAHRRAEAVLRRHSPAAMERYDALCAQGVDQLVAMREAAPLFIAVPATAASLATTADIVRAEADSERGRADRDRAAADLAATPADEAILGAQTAARHQQAADRAAGQANASVVAAQAYRATPNAGHRSRRLSTPTSPHLPSAVATRKAAR